MTCPYQLTCIGFSQPGDNACPDCRIREALERGAREQEAFLRATYPRPGDAIAGAPISAKPTRCKKSDADWVAGNTCELCDGCEVKT